MRGRPGTTGPHGTVARYKAGCDCAPCRTASRHYDILLAIDPLPRKVDGLGTRRRIQALRALGWSLTMLGRHLGTTGTAVGMLVNDDGPVLRSKADQIAHLYERLSMTPPPTTTHAEKSAVARTKTHAARMGWAPPLAWDDIDSPDETPDLGARAGGADPLEWKWLVDGGEDPTRAAERLGVAMTTIAKTARRKGLHDIARLAERYRERTAA